MKSRSEYDRHRHECTQSHLSVHRMVERVYYDLHISQRDDNNSDASRMKTNVCHLQRRMNCRETASNFPGMWNNETQERTHKLRFSIIVLARQPMRHQ